MRHLSNFERGALYAPGHKLTLNETTGNYHCQCYSWHWHKDDMEFIHQYARHVESEEKREAELLEEQQKQSAILPKWASTAVQFTATLAVFSLLMFTVLHFLG
jgi:ABC-type transport system involved in cytochrome bd biosynthesis fused ATPase/permease subunit